MFLRAPILMAFLAAAHTAWAALPAPGLTVTARGSSVLVWDTIATATEYRIYRATDAAGFEPRLTVTAQTGSPSQSFEDVSTTCQAFTYTYRVVPMVTGVEDTPSPDRGVSILCAPRNLTVSVSDLGVVLSYISPSAGTVAVYGGLASNAAVPAKGYSPAAGFSASTGFSLTFTTQFAGPTQFGVIAVDTAGNSGDALVLPGQFPAAPFNLSGEATGQNGEVTLAWQQGNTPGVTAYTVYRATHPFDPGTDNPFYVAGKAVTLTGGVNGQIQYYRVASNAGPLGPGPASAPIGRTPFILPQAPTITAAVAAPFEAALQLTWTESMVNGIPVGAYFVETNWGAGFGVRKVLGGSATFAKVTALCGVSVVARVRAMDFAGRFSPYSLTVAASAPCPPLFPAVSAAGAELGLTFTAALNFQPISQVFFALSPASGGPDPYPALVTPYASAATGVTTLVMADGSSAYLRAYAIDAQNVSSAASAEIAWLPAPQSVTLTPSFQKLHLRWQSVKTATAPGISSYAVYYDTVPPSAAGLTVVADPGVGAFAQLTLTGLANDTLYSVSISASSDSSGGIEGSLSQAFSARTGHPTPLISSLGQVQGGFVTLSWSASSIPNVALYKIYRATESTLGTAMLALTISATTASIALTGSPGVTDYYFVAVSDTAGTQSTLTPALASAVAVPNLAMPVVSVALTTNSRVRLSWTPVALATEYQVYKATGPGLVPLTDSSLLTTATQFIDVSPFNGQANPYRVLARRRMAPGQSFVESPLSVTVNARTMVPPGIPGRVTSPSGAEIFWLSATAAVSSNVSGTSMALSWAPARPGSFLVTRYVLYRGGSLATLQKFADVPASVSTVVDAGLTMGFTYFYAIEAEDNDVPPNVSGRLMRTVVLRHPLPPMVIAGPLANPVRAHLTMTAASSPNAVEAFEIYRSLSPGDPSPTLLPLTRSASFFDDLVAPPPFNRQYYRVHAVDNLGLRSLSFTAAEVMLTQYAESTSAPQPVLGVSAISLTGTAIQVNWQPSPRTDFVTRYHIYRNGALAGTAANLTLTPISTFLDPGTAYGAWLSYTVQAENSFGAGLSSTAFSFYHAPPAPAALDLEIDPYESTSLGINLAWSDLSATAGVASYEVFRATFAFASSTEASTLGSVTYTSFRDTTVAPGQLRYYRVISSYGGVTSSAMSPSRGITVTALPTGPAGSFSAVPVSLGGKVALSWSGVIGALKIGLFRGPVKIAELDGAETSYVDASPAAGTSITYGMSSYNFSGFSALSQVTYTVQSFPTVPTNLTASAGYGSGPEVSLSWLAPTHISGAVTGYDVFRDSSFLAYTTQTSYVDSSLPGTNVSIAYQVRSVSGTSSALSAAAVVKAYNPPTAVLGLTATSHAGGISLLWDAAPLSEGVTSYQAFYWHPGLPEGATRTVQAGVFSLAVTNVASANQVSATVRALNSAGAGPTALVSARANLAGGAFAPLSFSAKVGFVEAQSSVTRVNLNWLSQGNGHAFQIYRAPYATAIPVSLASGGPSSPVYLTGFAAGATSATDFQVQPEQPYSYALTSLSSTGFPSGESLPLLLYPVIPYNSPDHITFTAAQAGDGRVDFSWTEPAYKGSAGGPVSYLLYRYGFAAPPPSPPTFKSMAPDPGFPVALGGNAYADLTVENGKRYFYFMSVSDSAGREADTAIAPLVPGNTGLIPDGLRQPPRHLEFASESNAVSIRWVASKAESDAGVKYNVYRRVQGNEYMGVLPYMREVGPSSNVFSQSLSFVVQTLVDQNVTMLEDYCYSISAVTSRGEGVKSEEYCGIKPFTPVQPPANSRVDLSVINKKEVQLGWDAAVSVTTTGFTVSHYRVYRSPDGGVSWVILAGVTHTAAPTYSFTDANTAYGASYTYRITPVDAQTPGREGVSYQLATISIPGAENNILVFRNSFNPDLGESCPVQYSLVSPGHAWVKVFTLQGELVATLFDEEVAAASEASPWLSDKKTWDGKNSSGQTVASGVYVIHLEANGFKSDARVAVIK